MIEPPTNSPLRIVSTTRVQPLTPPPQVERAALGICDNATAGYSPPMAIWFYDALRDEEHPHAFSASVLLHSLRILLGSYPFLAGKLEHIPFRTDGDWTERQGRLRVSWGNPDDPGILVCLAECDQDLPGILPDARSRGRVWDATVNFGAFAGTDLSFALSDGYTTGADLPPCTVKLTKFACGGTAIAIRMQHVLGDAHSFIRIVHEWAALHRALISGGMLPQPKLLFDPDMQTAQAAGNINGAEPDSNITAVAAELPVHRLDWYKSSAGCHSIFQTKAQIPTELTVQLRSQAIPALPVEGPAIPWSDWDLDLHTPHYVLHFTAEDITRFHTSVASSESVIASGLNISKLDALEAHLWAAVLQARNLPSGDEAVYLNFAMNFRSRFSPPLPDALIGDPACMVHAKSMGAELREASADVTKMASILAVSIRRAVQSFNSDTLPCLLHEIAFQVGAQRAWQFFGGQHHTTVTSWLHHRMCEVDFVGSGRRPRFVEPLMPGCIMQLMESRYADNVKSAEVNSQRPWWSTGVEVSFNLERSVTNHVITTLMGQGE